MENEPQLAKPGAGLPFLEWVVAKYIVIPVRFKEVSQEQGLNEFNDELGKILSHVRALPLTDLNQRRLIPRLRGLEDSSRFWSVAMTLQHLVIVNRQMKQVIISLSNGFTAMSPTAIVDVKPPVGSYTENVVTDFENMARSFIGDLSSIFLEGYPKATYPHPWFGQLSAKQWLLFAAPHMQIHRKQIAEIIKRL